MGVLSRGIYYRLGISIAVVIHSLDLSAHTISKSKCYSRYETRNELRYYEPPVLVTYGLRIGIS